MIINMEQFKRSKSFEETYQRIFLPSISKILGNKNDTYSLLLKLYCVTRYIEGTSNGIFILNELELTDAELDEGKEEFAKWLKEISEDLRDA